MDYSDSLRPHLDSTFGETLKIACLEGHFGHSNLGDHELWRSFMLRFSGKFDQTITLSNISILGEYSKSEFRSPPYYYLGWRKPRGWLNQRRFWNSLPQDESSRKVLVWMGGLLGEHAHIAIRLQSLRWAIDHKWNPSYWFGDVEEKAKNSVALRKVVDAWNKADSWIGVRSEEAAILLKSAGLQRQAKVGLDPVLYRHWTENSNTENSNIDFRTRRQPIALISPCHCNMEQSSAIEFWSRIVRIIQSKGLQVIWGVFDRASDLLLAERVAHNCGYSHREVAENTFVEEAVFQVAHECLVCVSARYHGAIIPLSYKIPTIAIAWNSKIHRLYDLLGIDAWSIKFRPSIEQLSFESTIELLLDRAIRSDFKIDEAAISEQIETHTLLLKSFERWIDGQGGQDL